MPNKIVSVIDIGSSEIRVAIGERGVNNTFVIKGKSCYPFDGFSNGVFFNLSELKNVLFACGEFIKKVAGKDMNTIYVGVPGCFTKVIVKNSQISFPKKKKITEQDVDKLYDSAFVMNTSKNTLINRSAVVFELNDFRRLAYPVGVSSEVLKGNLSFILCDNYFIECIKSALTPIGFSTVEFISVPLAEAMYLFDDESRDRIAVLADIGYITTTVSVIQGDGIIYQRSFDFGGGYITAGITEKYECTFSEAETVKRKTSLSSSSKYSNLEIINDENGKYYAVSEVKEIIKNCLDEFCEQFGKCLSELGFVLPDYVPLKITGGGISFIRGANEHLADRLSMSVETVASKVPLMDNPVESSLLSLLDISLRQ